jgi:hypothetical protein
LVHIEVVMKKYYSEGGTQNPDFLYRVRVKNFTTEMFEWCEAYDDQGDPLCRFHVNWDLYGHDHDRVTFEQEAPAIMFALRFGRA